MASPDLGQKPWAEPRLYDAVTCMFAIHYFFVSEAALKQFLQNVASNLKDGALQDGAPDLHRHWSARSGALAPVTC